MNNNSSFVFYAADDARTSPAGFRVQGKGQKERRRSLERSPRKFASLQTTLETSRDASARAPFFLGQSIVVARAPIKTGPLQRNIVNRNLRFFREQTMRTPSATRDPGMQQRSRIKRCPVDHSGEGVWMRSFVQTTILRRIMVQKFVQTTILGRINGLECAYDNSGGANGLRKVSADDDSGENNGFSRRFVQVPILGGITVQEKFVQVTISRENKRFSRKGQLQWVSKSSRCLHDMNVIKDCCFLAIHVLRNCLFFSWNLYQSTGYFDF